MEILYPIYYGTRMVTFDVLKATFEPRMHPEFWRRMENFLLAKNGKFGIGGGFRPTNTQPKRPGFAPEGKSFHQAQRFPSGYFYCALDMVVANPGGVHRAPRWEDVPKQGSLEAANYGVHMNIATESWHQQPIEIDGWETWVVNGRKDLQLGRKIVSGVYTPPLPQPPVPPSQPEVRGIVVEFTSRELMEGSTGKDVKFYQRQLNEIAGQGLLLDGWYGPTTTQAVRNWQSFFGLAVDGLLGPSTQRSIIEVSLQA